MKISVIIPFYIRTELLRVSVGSVLSQTYPVHEIILVNDCSPEKCDWISKEFPQVKILKTEKNSGSGAARVLGVNHATGTHVASLDCDDFWYSDKLEKQVCFYKNVNDPSGIYSHRQHVRESKDIISIRPTILPIINEPICEYLYVRNGLVQTNTLFMQKSVYLESAFHHDVPVTDDWEMVIVGESLGHQIYMQEDSLSQWNCLQSDSRESSTFSTDYYYTQIERMKGLITAKAAKAMLARNLAPRHMANNNYTLGINLLLEAFLSRSLSLRQIGQIFMLHYFPFFYRRLALIKSYVYQQ